MSVTRALILGLCSCIAPFRLIPATRDAVASRHIARLVRHCMFESNGWPPAIAACRVAEDRACHAEHLEDGCGSVELFMDCMTASDASGLGEAPHTVDCGFPPSSGRMQL